MSNCHVCFHYKGSPACVAVKATGEHCPAEPITDAAIMSDMTGRMPTVVHDEITELRARVKVLEGALELAENRLRRRALDFDPTTPLAYETREWADEARQALKGDKQS